MVNWVCWQTFSQPFNTRATTIINIIQMYSTYKDVRMNTLYNSGAIETYLYTWKSVNVKNIKQKWEKNNRKTQTNTPGNYNKTF